ncbi:MAG: hypothetical protein OJI67_18980 [Prosthecobacter sp.]|nr:hypothetical protein [Prosthecobacter sp.]
MKDLVFIGLIIALLAMVWAFNAYQQHRKYARLVIVSSDVEYPNNHHVLGVGYYHASVGRWFVHPWNEFREEDGYFWEGKWHSSPDQRMTLRSKPSQSEVERVNTTWRKNDPDKMATFWGRVERSGFGSAVARQEGS